MSKGLRFPAALQIFPKLRDFIHLTPRRLANVPIGARTVRNEDIPACLRHVYHDLGVLVFAGLNNDQIASVGDVVQRVVASGGVGSLLTTVDWQAKAKRRRLDPVQRDDYFTAVDWAHSGVLKPQTLVRIADEHLPEEITSAILLRLPSIDLDTVQLRERAMQIRGTPSPRGVLHSTVDGPRILPMECFTSIRVDEKYSNIHGEIILFSGGGKGQYVGAITVDYNLYTIDEERAQMKTLWFDSALKGGRRSWREVEDMGEGDNKTDIESETLNALRDNVLKPLWKLEEETYGEKADRLVRYDEFKVGLRRWAGKQSRKGKKNWYKIDGDKNGETGEENKENKESKDVATW